MTEHPPLVSKERLATALAIFACLGVIATAISIYDFKIQMEHRIPTIDKTVVDLIDNVKILSVSITELNTSITLFERDREGIMAKLEKHDLKIQKNNDDIIALQHRSK